MSTTLTWRDNDETMVIRTDFAHETEWTEIQLAIVEPQTEDDFMADVRFVDDRSCDGLTVPQLLELVPADSNEVLVFIVDTETLTHPDRPVLAVRVWDYEEGGGDNGKGPDYGSTFRVIPSEMWAVENNISLANMDWEDFTDNVDDDGIFRGF